MQLSSSQNAMRPYSFFLLLSIAISFLILWGFLFRAINLPPVNHSPEILATSPPPDVSIELSDHELAELTEAYQSGFDHPDPEQNDPCERLRLLPYKKMSAWRRQFRKRGFTMDKIKSMLKNGRRETYMHPEKAVSYTKIYDRQGNWIVVDFADCLIWQIAPYNFK